MVTAAENQWKVSMLSIKYALIREMLNKVTFFMNVFFMILNNASFILQWVILYHLKGDVGGYTFKQVLLLWGMAASTYGVSHFFFNNAHSMSDMITNGKLDSYLVQPKNVLISAITSSVDVSAMGDMIYGIIMVLVSGFTIMKFLLFVLFSILGGIIMTDVIVILGSLSFWIGKSDMIADSGSSTLIHFATYPDGIFKGVARFLLYTIIPVGIIDYIPVQVLTAFHLGQFMIVLFTAIFLTIIAFLVFYRGLRRYSSSSLMIAKI